MKLPSSGIVKILSSLKSHSNLTSSLLSLLFPFLETHMMIDALSFYPLKSSVVRVSPGSLI